MPQSYKIELEKYIKELDQIQSQGAYVFIKWDGGRTSDKKTVLIEHPVSGYLFRKDTDNLVATLKEAISDYYESAK